MGVFDFEPFELYDSLITGVYLGDQASWFGERDRIPRVNFAGFQKTVCKLIHLYSISQI